MTYREREALAERARKEHWARHANNKTYEQWQAEQSKCTTQSPSLSLVS